MAFDTLPVKGEPAKVDGLTILVAVTCHLCEYNVQVMLLNGQPASCAKCGAIFNLDLVRWDKDNPVPFVGLSATPVIKSSLLRQS
jgi:hypothetical protein